MMAFLLFALLAFPFQGRSAAAPDLQISELMPSNGTALFDEDGDTPDWIELHNAGSALIDLAGYALSNDLDAPQKWTFPSVTLAPGARLVVWASGKDRPGAELHTSFSLAASGEAVVLTDPDAVVIDAVPFGALPSDISYGRSGADPDVWQVFDVPTPGGANGAGYDGIAAQPTLGVPEGRYAETVAATASTSHSLETLRYTLDGSLPTVTDAELAGAVVFSEPGVLRVRAFRPDYLPSSAATATYVVGTAGDLPIFSLVVEPERLWSAEDGIYNEDNLYRDLEAPLHLSLVEADGAADFALEGGVRLHGGYTRQWDQKSLAVFARGRYGADAIEYPLFPELGFTEYQALVLRNSGNDWFATLFADALMQSLVEDAHLGRQAYRPTVVYLNGAYWGIHNLREKINEHYIARHYDVAPDAIDVLEYEWNVLDASVLHGDASHYDALIAYVEARETLTDEDLAYVGARVDLDSFVDYYASQVYFSNTDWPGNNNKFWRPRSANGRWRWLLFDTDAGFGYATDEDYENDMIAFLTDPPGEPSVELPESTLLFRRLLSSEAFRHRFANRLATFLNSSFESERVLNRIEAFAERIAAEIPRHNGRWPASATLWETRVERKRLFARERPAYVVEHLQEGLGLGAPTPMTVDREGAGSVRVSGYAPDAYPWTGTYFEGVPVSVEAIAETGWTFDGWSDGVDDAARLVDPGAPPLTARFVGSPPAETVVLNEIQYNPSAEFDTEDWVEVLNPTAETADLSGWVLSDDDDTHRFVIPAGTEVAPSGYVVLCRDAAVFAAAYPSAAPCVGDWGFGLSGGGDQVRLFDAAGALVDSVAYDDQAPWPPEADGNGSTLELVASGLDNTLAESWSASQVVGGTPGAFNSVSTDADDAPSVPSALQLSPVFPNPSRGRATLRYELPVAGPVSLRVYDTLGREVIALDEAKDPGVHEVTVEAARLPSGVYIVRVRTPRSEAMQRMTIAR